MEKKTVKITNAFIENFMVSSPALINNLRERELDPEVGYWIAFILQKLQDLTKIYLGQKQKLLSKFARDKDKDGNIITNSDGTITIGNVTDFSKQLNKLLEIEVDTGIEKININFKKLPSLKVKEMEFLITFFENSKSKK